MKKGGTAAVKLIRNFSEHKLTSGLDLGDRSSCYCVLDETGRILVEQRVSTTQPGAASSVRSHADSRIALETGMHSPWMSQLLSGLRYETIVAHAQRVPDRREPPHRRSAGRDWCGQKQLVNTARGLA